MGIFKACDIRGEADAELTDGAARAVARAIGVKLAGKRAVVGGDVRLSTPRLKRIVIEELAASGCDVVDILTVATPMFYYAVNKVGASGGVMVTASHNPPEYNGFKLVLGASPVSEEEIAEIAALTEQNAFVRGSGSVETLDVAELYLADTADKAKRGNLKVVVDAGNGAASKFAPALYRRLGYTVTELFCKADGRFPNRPPNPAIPENLTRLQEATARAGADLGVAFDGDGDRAAFVDETGRAVRSDDSLALLAKFYLAQGPGAVIYDAKCSMSVPEEIEKAGGRAVMARAGHTFSKRAFLAENALFAGEVSGHFFFRELGYDDGMFAGLKMCECVARYGKLSALADQVPKYFLTPEARVWARGADREALLKETAKRLGGYRLNLIDGVRVELGDAWGMIRASVTEPIFTFRFEAKSRPRLLEVERILAGALPEEIKDAVWAETLKLNERG